MLVKEGLKFTLFVFLIAAVTLVIHYSSPAGLSSDSIRDLVSSFGNLSIIVFIIITGIASALSVPLTIFTFVGAVLFGVVEGTVVNLLGSLLGATLGFFLAKSLGRNFVQSLTGEKLAHIQSEIKKKGFTIVFLWRLAPIFPFSLVNYSAGLSQITFKDYFLSTLAGHLPNNFIITYLCATLGTRLLEGNVGLRDIASLPVMMAILIFVAFIIIQLIYHARIHKRN